MVSPDGDGFKEQTEEEYLWLDNARQVVEYSASTWGLVRRLSTHCSYVLRHVYKPGKETQYTLTAGNRSSTLVKKKTVLRTS